MSNVDEGGDLDACMHVCMHACIYAVRGKPVVTLLVSFVTPEREGNVWLVVLVCGGMKKDCWHNVASHWDWAR